MNIYVLIHILGVFLDTFGIHTFGIHAFGIHAFGRD